MEVMEVNVHGYDSEGNHLVVRVFQTGSVFGWTVYRLVGGRTQWLFQSRRVYDDAIKAMAAATRKAKEV